MNFVPGDEKKKANSKYLQNDSHVMHLFLALQTWVFFYLYFARERG